MGKKTKKKDRKSGNWRHADSGVVRFFSRGRRKSLTAFMKVMTRIGDGWLWFILIVVFFIIDVNAGLGLIMAMAIQIGLQLLLKAVFSRDRPYIKHPDIENLMLPPDKFSFPSGHTGGAFAVAFVVWFFFPMLFVPFAVIALLIAVSRIYLGLHYPSDVLAGILLGFISARLAIFLVLLIDL